MKNLLVSAALAALFIIANRAHAAVIDSSPNGFTVTETAHIAASPDKVWTALIAPGNWWSSEHSFSHDARNMTLEARAGGCWCEALPNGGSALFMTVILVEPERSWFFTVCRVRSKHLEQQARWHLVSGRPTVAPIFPSRINWEVMEQ